ncbi:hypothetical protein FTUN_7559 [Frigoriglobus tundricola]|uniref:Uncharacterized protein n=1 Tax=Frigoriglobus tundricola TaxID=2774151 RepID=A0A6M5Z2I5_9BACT|nr:hypothetical protein FTUN_7559 [Frigoriglobus tundricola]
MWTWRRSVCTCRPAVGGRTTDACAEPSAVSTENAFTISTAARSPGIARGGAVPALRAEKSRAVTNVREISTRHRDVGKREVEIRQVRERRESQEPGARYLCRAEIEAGQVLNGSRGAQVLVRQASPQQEDLDDRFPGAGISAGDRSAELLHERGGLVLGILGAGRSAQRGMPGSGSRVNPMIPNTLPRARVEPATRSAQRCRHAVCTPFAFVHPKSSLQRSVSGTPKRSSAPVRAP